MKIYYYPFMAQYATGIPVRLYTEEVVASLTEPEQKGLKELDEAAIQMIGQRPCVFQKPTSKEKRYQAMVRARLIAEEWKL